MSLKSKRSVGQLTAPTKHKYSGIIQPFNVKRYNQRPMDMSQTGGAMVGEGAILDLIKQVAPHLLAPIASALGERVGKFVRGEGTRLAGNGTRLAGNGTRLAGNGMHKKKTRM